MQSHSSVVDDDLLDKKFFYWSFLSICCLYLQFIPVINYILVAILFFFIIICFYKRWPSGFIPILALSFLHGNESVSIYTLKISGVSLFYVLIISLFTLKLLTRRKVSRVELFILLLFCIYFIYSVLNKNYIETSYFINDSLFLLIGILFLYSIYDFKNVNIEKILFAVSLGYFFTKILVYLTGVGLQVTAYSSHIDQYSAIFDPIENLLLIFNLQSFIFPKNKAIRMLSLLNLMLFGLSAYLLGYMHGATIVLVIIILFYALLRNVKLLLILSTLCCVLLFISVNIDFYSLFYTQKESVFLFKVQKVIGLFEFLYQSDISIYDLPRSTQVRLIETANLIGQNPLSFFFGNGFGGYLTETIYSYGSYLNADDYSLDQIASGKYQLLHAYNQIILKHGLLSLLIALITFWRFRRAEDRNFRDTALIFIVLSYSFTIKPFLILALLVFSLKDKGQNNA